jgi:predicted phosphodiesterase
MGWLFDIEHANFVAYLTAEQEKAAPRADFESLRSFLDALSLTYIDGEELARFISSQRGWIEDIHFAAKRAADRLTRPEVLSGKPDRIIVNSREVENVLNPLRPLFSGYSIYALIIPGSDIFPGADYRGTPEGDFFREAALSSEGGGLVLMPHRRSGLFNILDPFPAIQTLAEMPVRPPSVVLWTGLGAACALPLSEAKSFFRNVILDRIRAGKKSVDDAVRKRASEVTTGRLLHISDLHFGEPKSDSVKRYIKAQFDLVLPEVNRVVVTGDLFNTPDANLRDQFLEFRSDVQRMTDKALIVIPGNHDVRPKGNVVPGVLRQNYEFVFDIGMEPIIIDEELGCVFFCFNSAEGGNLARGSVSDSQRMRIATSFDEERARRKRQGKRDVDAYVKVAVVHHHPFAYETNSTTVYDAALRVVTGDEDTFTRFEEAEKFISWCAERGVSLVLHGHKHVPHHVQADVRINGRIQKIVVVGCGSTTGAEGTDLCYDIVSLNPEDHRWGVTFHRDASKSGAGFRVDQVTIDTRTMNSAW